MNECAAYNMDDTRNQNHQGRTVRAEDQTRGQDSEEIMLEDVATQERMIDVLRRARKTTPEISRGGPSRGSRIRPATRRRGIVCRTSFEVGHVSRWCPRKYIVCYVCWEGGPRSMFCPRSRGCSEDSAMSEQRSPPRPDLLTDGERDVEFASPTPARLCREPQSWTCTC